VEIEQNDGVFLIPKSRSVLDDICTLMRDDPELGHVISFEDVRAAFVASLGASSDLESRMEFVYGYLYSQRISNIAAMKKAIEELDA
jgi:hypothetical protein